MYKVKKSIDIDFAHHVHGHSGPCINIHGHTWKFELELAAGDLDNEGFVVDFKWLKHHLLEPVHSMLDHGFAIKMETFDEMKYALYHVHRAMRDTRLDVHGCSLEYNGRWLFRHKIEKDEFGQLVGPTPPTALPLNTLGGAYDVDLAGLKVIVFPVAPTSERLAEWLHDIARSALKSAGKDQVTVVSASVYETLHPVESVATYQIADLAELERLREGKG